MDNEHVCQVAIDGPVGAGKSTVARLAANKAGFIHIDTGAIYRAVALHAARSGVSPRNAGEREIQELLEGADISFDASNNGQRVFLNGEDVTEAIRTAEMSQNASDAAVNPTVRRFATARARELAASRSVVMDGRDIGTVVLPKAEVKVYLDASADIRAKRRYNELAASGAEACLEDIKREVEARDFNDSNREADPLRKADGAVVIDAGGMSAEEAAEAVLSLIQRVRAKERG